MKQFKFCSEQEASLARKLVTAALFSGLSISVCDGDEFPLRKSKNKESIYSAMNSTESDILWFWRDDIRLGCVVLIWGNGEDLISDYTDSPEIKKLVEQM